MFHDPRLARMSEFLGTIGISMTAGPVDVPTVFPGSLIARGALVIGLEPEDHRQVVAPYRSQPQPRRLEYQGILHGPTVAVWPQIFVRPLSTICVLRGRTRITAVDRVGWSE